MQAMRLYLLERMSEHSELVAELVFKQRSLTSESLEYRANQVVINQTQGAWLECGKILKAINAKQISLS